PAGARGPPSGRYSDHRIRRQPDGAGRRTVQRPATAGRGGGRVRATAHRPARQGTWLTSAPRPAGTQPDHPLRMTVPITGDPAKEARYGTAAQPPAGGARRDDRRATDRRLWQRLQQQRRTADDGKG